MRIRSAQITQNHNQKAILDIPGMLLHHFPVERPSEVT